MTVAFPAARARGPAAPGPRALAAGKATVITDLAHLTGYASLDPRTWLANTPADNRYPMTDIRSPMSDLRWSMSDDQKAANAADTSDLGHRLSGIGYRSSTIGTSEAMCVAIDILDEDHSLRLAMRRLAQ